MDDQTLRLHKKIPKRKNSKKKKTHRKTLKI